MAIVVVLVVIALLSLGGYTYCELMLSEHEAADLSGRHVQTRLLCQSGLEMSRRLIAQDADYLENAGGLYNNANRFMGQLVLDGGAPADRGRFTIIAPPVDTLDGAGQGLRYGLENESARLNLNTLLWVDKQQQDGGRTLLMGLPGMTEEIADAILDWIDEDDEPRPLGAEVNDYAALDPPYRPKNGQLETVEELLLVRGVTPYLLFGPDANRNGVVDTHEQGAEALAGVDNSDGSFNRGWSGYLTLYSMEKNLKPDGTPRIDLNSDDLATLQTDLEESLDSEWAKFIILYRQFGPYTGTQTSTNAPQTVTVDLTRNASYTISTILELVGAKTQARMGNSSSTVVLSSPLKNDPVSLAAGGLDLLLENCTANGNPRIPGRVNVNLAPKAVLLGIPGMTEEIVERILGDREPESTGDDDSRRYETWLLTEGIVTLDEMKGLMPYVTAAGDVWRVHVVGFYDQGGPSARIEAVIDASEGAPRLLFWRDVSHLGRGFPLDVLGAAVSSPLP